MEKLYGKIKGYERMRDKNNKDRGSLMAMLSPYYLYYMRTPMVMKQGNIDSDAKPVLWNHVKRNTPVMWRIYI